MITCPRCNELSAADVRVYNSGLKKQNFNLSPILPTCKKCGSDVSVTHTCQGGSIVILNGTCGSGKSAVAERLTNCGFLAVDGDCAIQSLRYKKGMKQYEWAELIREIFCEIDILSLYSPYLVLSHIVLPEDMDGFIEQLTMRNMNFKFILLKPDYQTAVERCRTRTCHEHITSEKWIQHFYTVLSFDGSLYHTINNTGQSVEETARIITELPYSSAFSPHPPLPNRA